MIEAVKEQESKAEYGLVSEKANRAAKWAGTGLGFSIPVSTALDSILGVSVAAFWVFGAGYRKKWDLVRGNPVAMLSLGMFGLLVLGGFYSDASWGEVFKVLGKYSDLLLLSLLIPLFQDVQMRRNGLAAFFLTMVVVLLLSYLISFGVFPGGGPFKGFENYGIVFRSHITHNLLVAFSAFAFATLARVASSPHRRILWIALAVMAIFNLLFMVPGRTGYLVLGVLVVYFFVDWLRWKGFVIDILGGSVIGVCAFFLSDVFHARLSDTTADFHKWSSGQVPDLSADSEEGGLWLRLAFYQNSLAIIRDSPVFGVGTGGFASAFAEKVKNSRVPPTSNPHNEYVLIAVQLGLVGLGVLLYLFYIQWHLAADLPGLFERNLARGLVLTVMTTCLFNSSLLDHGEGIFYAWMSGLLFAGLNSRDEKDREAIQCPFWRS
ncbi:MAG: O-antigen ligase family protein [candidate division NC10 bacterium]|nr:O-antigen ligase family protein [candidate division NC10 bacterium]